MDGWSVGRLVGWVSCLGGWVVGWMIGMLVGSLFSCLVVKFIV